MKWLTRHMRRISLEEKAKQEMAEHKRELYTCEKVLAQQTHTRDYLRSEIARLGRFIETGKHDTQQGLLGVICGQAK